MDVREALIAMRKLLTPEGAWTQAACWRDGSGNPTVEIENAVSHCLYGAAQSIGGTVEDHFALCRFLNDHCDGFIEWNDAEGRTQAEVLALLDEGIAELDPLRLDYEFEWDIPAREYELEDA